MAKDTLLTGVKMHDLQGSQASLANMEAILHVVLEHIGTDCVHRRSLACQQLIEEVGRTATIVASKIGDVATLSQQRGNIEGIGT